MPRSFSHVPLGNPRPRERVERFLSRFLSQKGCHEERRLPTNRELAEQLKVSVPTVRAALAKFSQEGKIRSRSGSGTFLVSAPGARRGEIHALVCCFGVTEKFKDAWASPIYSGIFHAAGQQNPPVSLRSLVSETEPKHLVERVLKMRKKADGLILFPAIFRLGEERERVLRAFEEEGKPVVSLNPTVATETANFVSADYFGSSRQLGEAWRKAGRKRVLMVVHGSFGNSASAHQRFLGLEIGLAPSVLEGRSVRLMDSGGYTEMEGFETGKRILASEKPLPDAIFCLGDFLALGVCRALREAGLEIPGTVSVVGGTGMDPAETAVPDLTRTQHPLDALGRGLLEMLVARVRAKGVPVPGCYFPMPFAGGATTRPEENELLGIVRAPSHRTSPVYPAG